MFSTNNSSSINSYNDLIKNLQIADTEDYYEISYPRNLIPAQLSFRKSFSDGDKGSFKIKKSDLEAKGWRIDSKELMEYIANGLKIMVGFDFDQTLSNNHTWYHGPNTTLPNLKGGELTKNLLSEFAKQKNLYLFVATNNYTETVEQHLNSTDWNIQQYFKTIYGRDDFHSKGGDKELCFRFMYDQLKSDSAIDEKGFLNLDAAAKPIDLVSAVLLDDDVRYKAMEQYGIKYIQVSEQSDNVNYFNDLKTFCGSAIDLSAIHQNAQVNKNEEAEENAVSSHLVRGYAH